MTIADFNAYYRTDAATPGNVVRWRRVTISTTGAATASYVTYPTVAAFRTAFPAYTRRTPWRSTRRLTRCS